MFEIKVKSDFCAAHFLKNYHGKCENLHGHNYTVYAHARGSKLDEGGMLLDFGVLKNALSKVCKQLDHTNLNDIALFDENPSAERIAKYIFDRLSLELSDSDRLNGTDNKKMLYCVDVFETETNCARYVLDDD